MRNTKTTIAQRAVEIETPDGICDAVLVSPQAGGVRSGIVLYPDVKGLRPTKVEMATRLAASGYAVLVVNQFYRIRRAPIFPPSFGMGNPDDFAQAMKLLATVTHETVMRDATAFVAFLDAQPETEPGAKLGVVGFCMGGAMAIRTAAAAPDRIAAAVSLHGGSLVTPDPDSPHRLMSRTKADYYIGIAADDDERQPQDKVALKAALDEARLSATVEVYAGAKHGWMVPDVAPYDEAAAERGWTAMLAALERAFGTR
jgi:carboxymethylenebutenolidase